MPYRYADPHFYNMGINKRGLCARTGLKQMRDIDFTSRGNSFYEFYCEKED